MSESYGTSTGFTAPEEVSPQQEDYFGFGGEQQFTFPDGISYIAFRVMNEGQRKRYQQMVKSDMILDRKSGDARVGVDQAADRHALILTACTGWNLKRGGKPVPFNERSMRDFLEFANPAIVDKLDKEIREANPWLLNDLTVEDIDREIESLRERREEILKRNAGEGSSSSK